MTLIPEIRQELYESAARQAATRTNRRLPRFAHRPWTRGGVSILLASLISIAVVVLAIVLIRHGYPSNTGAPTPLPPTAPGLVLPANPSRQQRKEVDYLVRAQTTAFRDDPACRTAGPAGKYPTTSQGSPSPALLSILGVLRRPAAPTDELPTRVIGLDHQVIPNGSLPPAKDIYVRYIRRARWRFGAGYYIVPAGNMNPRATVPARCWAEQRAALQRELPQIPNPLRAGTLALEPRFINQQRYGTQPRAGVCLLALNDTGGGEAGCGDTATDIERGLSISSGGPTGVGVVYGIVPDGVATVTLYYPGHYPGHPLTVHAISNVFILPDPGDRLTNYGFPTKIVWRSANGTMIKTITRP